MTRFPLGNKEKEEEADMIDVHDLLPPPCYAHSAPPIPSKDDNHNNMVAIHDLCSIDTHPVRYMY